MHGTFRNIHLTYRNIIMHAFPFLRNVLYTITSNIIIPIHIVNQYTNMRIGEYKHHLQSSF